MEKFKIPVVSAIIHDSVEGRILLAKRNYPESEKGQWCYPGGKVREDENVFEAIIRETQEETNLIVETNNSKFIGIANTGPYLLLFFLITKFEGIVCNMEPDKIEEYRWIKPQELFGLELTHGMLEFRNSSLYTKFLQLLWD